MKIHLICAALLALLCCGGCSVDDPNTMRIELMERRISFPGRIYPERFNAFADRANGHHFIVWSGGGNAAKALINTEVPDESIQAGLEALGGIPGDNLRVESWSARFDEAATEPDLRVEGSPVQIWISWEGKSIPAHQAFSGCPEEEFEIHFGGHEHLIPKWRSGCVVCLFSCPGGRMSNAAFTIRDQAQGRRNFLAEQGLLPPDGTKVMVQIQLLDEVESGLGASSQVESSPPG